MVNMQVEGTPPNALAIQLSFPISSKSDLKDSSIFLYHNHSHLLESQNEQEKEIILWQEIIVSLKSNWL